ncbi:MAG: MaoC family dehydratase N-terminal domain-containing protein [Actinobacteria bacterium]|nr:MaoC family dehydratase N-terminal domain-containing protein [Actinomycetota bacterium]
MAQSAEEERPFPSYENLIVGQELGPMYYDITERKVKEYCYAVDDWDPACFPPKPGSITPALLMSNDCLHIIWSKYSKGGGSGLHAKQDFEILNPVRVGKKITITGKVSDKYIKRDKKWMQTWAEVVDEDGLPIIRGTTTETRGSVDKAKGAPGEQPAPEAAPERPMGPIMTKAGKRVPIGAIISGPTKCCTQGMMSVFTGADRLNSIHTNAEFAHNLGLAGAVAQGMMTACYISETMTGFFGDGWRYGGKMALAFVGAVYAEDTIIAAAQVKEKVLENGVTRIVCEVWCENQGGRRVTVGTASGLIG